PLAVDLYTDNGTERKNIVISEQKQSFVFRTESDLKLLKFDAERQMLADIEYPKSIQTLIFQYNNTPLYVDRLEALQELSGAISQQEVYEIFRKAATSDTSYKLRNYALGKLEKISDDPALDLKGTL